MNDEDLLPEYDDYDNLLPEYDSYADAEGYEDEEIGRIFLFDSKGIKISYLPGQWNDSGVDPPTYSISISNENDKGYGANSTHWISIGFDRVSLMTPTTRYITYETSMNLTDFVKVVSSPFPLDLKDGQMGKFYEDEFNRKEIILEVDRDTLISKIEKLSNLKVFL